MANFDKARQVLESLVNIGCKQRTVLEVVSVTFDVPGFRLNASQTARFARLIRTATNLESDGSLVANTDRMGQVVGWHLGKESE